MLHATCTQADWTPVDAMHQTQSIFLKNDPIRAERHSVMYLIGSSPILSGILRFLHKMHGNHPIHILLTLANAC